MIWTPVTGADRHPRKKASLRAFGPALLLFVGALAASAAPGIACSEDEPCQDPRVCPPSTCIPSESRDAVSDACGVFVSSSLGDDANVGTKGLPVKTLARAVRLSITKRVYLCAEEIPGAAGLPSGLRVYGGLDCAGRWEKKEGARTTLTAGPSEIPLTLFGEEEPDELETEPIVSDGGVPQPPGEQDPIVLSDLHVIARDALKEGSSSIGIFAHHAIAEMTRCRVEAGLGGNGKSGSSPSEAATPGDPGLPGALACSADVVLGGDAVTTACGADQPLLSTGGLGGAGSLTGLTGGGGQPGMSSNGGLGDTGSGCTPGTPGEPGQPGAMGPGGAGQGQIGRAVFNDKPGYVGADGADGMPGIPGQGGGGGGGAMGGAGTGKCAAMRSDGGASGGSGGAGGCGGAGGKGGGAGGSSIAIVSLDTRFLFTEVELVTRDGGDGGDGGLGQKGGPGGVGGLGGGVPEGATEMKLGCDGGEGGTGGEGGPGGGGQGGHSIGIAFQGQPPKGIGVSIAIGGAGKGGKGGGVEGNGAPGKDLKTLNFPSESP